MDVQWSAPAPAPVEDPDTAYRNKLLQSIQTLAASLMENMTKLGRDDYHLFVTRLIEAENGLRELNEEVNQYCDAANNVAMKDEENGFADFGEEADGELELLTGDIAYELPGADGAEDGV